MGYERVCSLPSGHRLGNHIDDTVHALGLLCGSFNTVVRERWECIELAHCVRDTRYRFVHLPPVELALLWPYATCAGTSDRGLGLAAG